MINSLTSAPSPSTEQSTVSESNKKAALAASLHVLKQQLNGIIAALAKAAPQAQTANPTKFQTQVAQLLTPITNEQQHLATFTAAESNNRSQKTGDASTTNNPSLIDALLELITALNSFTTSAYTQMTAVGQFMGGASALDNTFLVLLNGAQTAANTYLQEVQSNTSVSNVPTFCLNNLYPLNSTISKVDSQGVLSNFINNGITLTSSQAYALNSWYNKAGLGNAPIANNQFKLSSVKAWQNLAQVGAFAINSAFNTVSQHLPASITKADLINMFPAGYALLQGFTAAVNNPNFGSIPITSASLAGMAKQLQLFSSEISSAGQYFTTQGLSSLKDLSSAIVQMIDTIMNIQASNVTNALTGS